MEVSINLNIDGPLLRVYYRHKKMTKNQYDFLFDLSQKILNKSNINLFEFPPTLDKDYLYISLLYSLKFQSILPIKKKFIIIVNSLGKIETLTNYISSIHNYYNKSNPKNTVISIPYFPRKYLCLNKEKLINSNSNDYDSFCLETNSSSANKNNSNLYCKYYKKLQQINNEKKINNSFHSFDIEDQFGYFNECEICPYYFYFYNIVNLNFDIVICTFDDFFNMNNNVSVNKMINYDNNINDYILLFDEVNNLYDKFIQNYSFNIDENIIKYSRIQINELKNKIVNNYSMNIDDDISIINNNIPPEKEILKYSLLINNNSKIPGNIIKNEHFLDLLTRLIIYFNKFFIENKRNDKNQSGNIITSTYYFEREILDQLWIDFDTIKFLYKKLILLFNEISFTDYSSMYHLITFVKFLNFLSLFNNGFIVNFAKNEKALNLEILCIEPNLLIEKILKNNNDVLLLSSGIGNIKIFQKIIVPPIKNASNANQQLPIIQNNNNSTTIKISIDYNKSQLINYKYYKDDLTKLLSKSSNIYLTNTSMTTTSNPDFYGEILKKLCTIIPDGIILYFSSNKEMNSYLLKWNSQKVFDYILDYKLIFIEENDPIRNSEIITNYKKSCNMGRGGLLILTMRNKMGMIDEDLINECSRCVLFIGYPIETRPNKIFEFKLEYLIKNYDIDNKNYFFYDVGNIFTRKIINKIGDSMDKKIIVILEKKLFDEDMKNYIPNWLEELMFNNEDENNNNVDDRMNFIHTFLAK